MKYIGYRDVGTVYLIKLKGTNTYHAMKSHKQSFACQYEQGP